MSLNLFTKLKSSALKAEFVIGQLTAFLAVAFFEGTREKGGRDEDE